MSLHKLQSGLTYIRNLQTLGKILGYYVEVEYQVPGKKNLGEQTAVDVAWFKEENQKFPLFIFEVESSASNSMAYNPMKVLAKPNQDFEKPLFLFQVVLSKGQNSSRIRDLKQLFGSYNYRVYRVAGKEDENLISDILEQHRRLSNQLEIVGLINFLISSKWINISVSELTDKIIELKFEMVSGDLFPSLATLGLQHDVFVDIFCQSLKRIIGVSLDYSENVNYKTYFGSYWGIPIHLGLLALYNTDISEKVYCFQKFKTWQENGGHLSMIGPHFRLNHDYDTFLVFGVGGLIGVLASLFQEVPNAKKYLIEILHLIIQNSAERYRIFNYLWLMQISSSDPENKKYYDSAIKFFKKLNSFSLHYYQNLPLIFNEDSIEVFLQESDEIPQWNKTQELDTRLVTRTNILRNGISLLVDPKAEDYGGKFAIAAITYKKIS